jgi:predicted nucleic acid-binding protein
LLIVDTNVLVDVLEDDPEWGEWSVGRMRDLARVHEIVINPVIYAELSLAFDAVEDLDAAIADLDLGVIELPRPALFLAGKAFVRYRRLGGIKSNVLADFFIGAHAAVAGCPILTRDPRRYRSYFPSLRLIVPDAGTPT